ncbi:hypothetical protein FQZ97_1025490 [compost metagenome]
MPMSRLWEGTVFITASSNMRLPSVTSSSPAIMLRVVDLPQPDGPSRTRNSLSAMSRLRFSSAAKPLGYFLPTASNLILATV